MIESDNEEEISENNEIINQEDNNILSEEYIPTN